MYHEPENVGAADRVLKALQAQLEQSRMRQRVRKDGAKGSRNPDALPIPDTPGRRIVYLRKLRKVTQKTLAEAVGITTATLSKYETGSCPFRTDLLIRFAGELATTTDFLLCLTERADASDKGTFPETELIKKQKRSAGDAAENRLLVLLRSVSEPHKRLLIDMITLFCEQVANDPECYPEVIFYQMR